MKHTLSTSQNVAIAGAGLVGRLLAWRLKLLGHNVTLFDAGVIHSGSTAHPKSAAYTAAAMISPLSEVVVSERAIYEMGIHSISLWERWVNELPPAFALHYKRNGSIVVAHPNDESELEQFQQDLNYHLGRANNSRWLDQHALHELEPDLSAQFSRGLFLPCEAFIDNRAFLDNLLLHIQSLGVNLYEHTPIEFSPAPHVKNLDEKENNTLDSFDCWFDTRGMGAKTNHEVRGVRGEVIWVETNEVKLNRPVRLMHPRYKLYIVPKPGNKYILGATEIESEDNSPMSVQSALELCSALYTLNPAFSEARILEIDTNLRPSLIDNMPCVALSESGNTPIVTVNGLYRHGYLLAPSLIEYALQAAQLLNECSPFESTLKRNTL